jgi:hypothetical protein
MESSILIKGWQGLAEAAGINALTGEACSYSQRLVCDVNEEGLDLLKDFFGVPKLQLEPSWNSRVNNEPAVGSIMLSRRMLTALAEFVMARKNALAIIYGGGDQVIMGIFEQELLDRYAAAALPQYTIQRLYTSPGAVGSRNIHAASGRLQ